MNKKIFAIVMGLCLTQSAFAIDNGSIHETLLTSGRIQVSACHSDGHCDIVGNQAGYTVDDIRSMSPALSRAVGTVDVAGTAAWAFSTGVVGLVGAVCGKAVDAGILAIAAVEGIGGATVLKVANATNPIYEFRAGSVKSALIGGIADLKSPGDSVAIKVASREKYLQKNEKVAADVLKSLPSDRTSPPLVSGKVALAN